MEITVALAEMLAQVANDDAEKLARLCEIYSWFSNLAMIYGGHDGGEI